MPKLPGRGGPQVAPAYTPALGLDQFVGAGKRATQQTIDSVVGYARALETAPPKRGQKPCTDCGLHPKKKGHPLWCPDCWLRRQPMDVRIQQSRLRLGSVRIEDHKSRAEARLSDALPLGADWCTGCQAWRPLVEFKPKQTRCEPCVSDAAHRSRADRTYEGGSTLYDQLYKLQNGKCAICGNRQLSKRLAEDHDHQTGAVRGLLCDSCNHQLLGAAHDSVDILKRAVWYLTNPPASGSWDVDAPPY